MTKISKFLTGLAFWVPSSYMFAYWAHIAPEGVYSGTDSTLEIISVLFMLAFFVGIPILTALWIFYEE